MQAALYEAPVDGPPGPGPGEPLARPAPEPVFNNLPWTAPLLSGVIVAGYALQSRFSLQEVANAYAFSPSLLGAGEWERLVTALFLHGSWPHALMNAAFVLAFGVPVARYFGARALGATLFFGLYIACGVLSNLAFAALHMGQDVALLGASGAASGLMGASARLIGGRGGVGPMFSRPVLTLGAAWLAVNVLMAFTGAAMIPGAGDAPIGWEAHLAGFLFGVLLLGIFARLARRA